MCHGWGESLQVVETQALAIRVPASTLRIIAPNYTVWAILDRSFPFQIQAKNPMAGEKLAKDSFRHP
jgi:hypothetical protein